MASLSLEPVSGRSHDGRPLAYHRAPAPDLAPWLAQLFVTEVAQPAQQTLACGLCNDTPFVRLLVRGAWEADTPFGTVRPRGGPMLFGPHSARMPVRVTGPFATFGFALRPGALAALGHPWGAAGPDMVVPIAATGEWRAWHGVHSLAGRSPEEWLDWLEDTLRRALPMPRRAPSPLTEAFDRLAFLDPSHRIGDFAAQQGVSQRAVERRVRADFGLPPKRVMRRARVLDMASRIVGFADSAEAEAMALRFYDQSHLIRDFRALLGCTPRQLALAAQPILALSLEARQARRLAWLGRASLPWREPPPAG